MKLNYRPAYKKLLVTVSVFIFLLNVVTLAAPAGNKMNAENEPLDCKWSQQQCETIVREVCLADGDGTTCACGTVSRPCE